MLPINWESQKDVKCKECGNTFFNCYLCTNPKIVNDGYCSMAGQIGFFDCYKEKKQERKQIYKVIKVSN
jgi:hypothetical protein